MLGLPISFAAPALLFGLRAYFYRSQDYIQD